MKRYGYVQVIYSRGLISSHVFSSKRLARLRIAEVPLAGGVAYTIYGDIFEFPNLPTIQDFLDNK